MTCEEYVVNRVQNLEAEVDLANKTADMYRRSYSDAVNTIAELKSDIAFIAALCTVKNASNNSSNYYSFDTVWESYDPEAYQRLSDILAKSFDIADAEGVQA